MSRSLRFLTDQPGAVDWSFSVDFTDNVIGLFCNYGVDWVTRLFNRSNAAIVIDYLAMPSVLTWQYGHPVQVIDRAHSNRPLVLLFLWRAEIIGVRHIELEFRGLSHYLDFDVTVPELAGLRFAELLQRVFSRLSVGPIPGRRYKRVAGQLKEYWRVGRGNARDGFLVGPPPAVFDIGGQGTVVFEILDALNLGFSLFDRIQFRTLLQRILASEFGWLWFDGAGRVVIEDGAFFKTEPSPKMSLSAQDVEHRRLEVRPSVGFISTIRYDIELRTDLRVLLSAYIDVSDSGLRWFSPLYDNRSMVITDVTALEYREEDVSVEYTLGWDGQRVSVDFLDVSERIVITNVYATVSAWVPADPEYRRFYVGNPGGYELAIPAVSISSARLRSIVKAIKAMLANERESIESFTIRGDPPADLRLVRDSVRSNLYGGNVDYMITGVTISLPAGAGVTETTYEVLPRLSAADLLASGLVT